MTFSPWKANCPQNVLSRLQAGPCPEWDRRKQRRGTPVKRASRSRASAVIKPNTIFPLSIILFIPSKQLFLPILHLRLRSSYSLFLSEPPTTHHKLSTPFPLAPWRETSSFLSFPIYNPLSPIYHLLLILHFAFFTLHFPSLILNLASCITPSYPLVFFVVRK